MIERLLLITCAAYLVAACPAYAQHDHDVCGGDSCATGAPYDVGYHDGYEGDSYTSSSQLTTDPQYEAGFSEGEMDAMVEKDALTAEKQVRDERLDDGQTDGRSIASRRAIEQDRAVPDREAEQALGREDDRGLDHQTDSTLDALLSGERDMAGMDEEDALTAQEQAGGWRQMDRRRDSYTDPDAGLLTTERNSNN